MSAEKPLQSKLVRRARTKQSFKLRLLALVLALALAWYSLNPAPGSTDRIKREDEVPDGKKREAKPGLQGANTLPGIMEIPGAKPGDKALANRNEDDFDWPEFIDG